MATTLEARELRFTPPSYTTLEDSARLGGIIIVGPTRFNESTANALRSSFPKQRIIEVLQNKGNLDPQTSMNLTHGEIKRIEEMLATMHDATLGIPAYILTRIGIETGIAGEIGPSMLAHLSPLQDMGIGKNGFTGIENVWPVALGANALIEEWDIPNAKVILGNERTRLRKKGDIFLSSLVAQYSGGLGIFDCAAANAKYATSHADTFHSPSPKRSKFEIDSVHPIESSRCPGLETGIAMKIQNFRGLDVNGNRMYNAKMVLSENVYGNNPKITHLATDRDRYDGCVVTEIEGPDGRPCFIPWGVEALPEATEEQIRQAGAFTSMVIESYMHLKEATRRLATVPPRRPQEWESNVITAFPAYAAEKGYYSGVVLTSTAHMNVSSNFMPALVLRNGENLATIRQAGLLSQVGEGKPFTDLEEARKAATRWVNDPGMGECIAFRSPPIAAILSTEHEEVYRRMKELRKAA